ncbi:MAG: GNAT family N-acetyltransferase [Rhizobiaceae bacterium]|nr:GNAT family N-acetyltransferase [Rhizobiaceae bacterium]
MAQTASLDIALRAARSNEAARLTELCLRSKAHWGYDRTFMEACRSELTVTPETAAAPLLRVATIDGGLAAVAEIGEENGVWHLDKLFVDPRFMGLGLGRLLLEWAADTAAARGATLLNIAADPDAVPFYEHHGARRIGDEPSGSIPGRRIPLLELRL